ncbi:Uncharacterized protein ESCO_003522 [Escovopsis weberi]|uniref:Galactinol synthase 1 n=1 Tax=Escovopsis weberi TaxID=150374 RepID=A0A0M9VXE1_ESCWE|nr:Uncharacterized protein ESCO_003522 [Escovopsis weberi]
MASLPAGVDSPRVYASLITNLNYLPGLLTLHHSLRAARSAFPFVALYTASLPPAGLAALAARGIPTLLVPSVRPASARDFSASSDPRFDDTWTKLVVFSLTQFSRVVLLDCDMLVRQNMDELMDVDLADADPPSSPPSPSSSPSSSPSYVLAAGHACVCNPLKKPHYPPEWTPANCAFTAQHPSPLLAQSTAPLPPSTSSPSSFNAGLNSGLLVLRPSAALYAQITAYMDLHAAEFTFPDQDLLSRLFRGRWRPLPYVYNALKTMRADAVHAPIWRDDRVKNVHYILHPKPWDEIDGDGVWRGQDELHRWWADANEERRREERGRGITDGM